MHKLFLLIISILFVINASYAQDDTDSIQNAPKNQWFLKLSPLAVFETDGGIGLSVEYVMPKQKLGIQVEIQPLLFSIQGNGGSGTADAPKDVLQSGPLRGIKLRPEIHYYFDGLKLNRNSNSNHNKPGKATRNLTTRTYLAVAFMYKQTQQQRTNEFNIYNTGTQPNYRLQAEYTDVKRVTQFECKFGVLRPLGKGHWLADVYFGMGIRNRKIFYRNLPPGASEPIRNGFFGGSPGTQSENFPSFPFGIRIVYRL